MVRSLEREIVDGNGNRMRVIVEIDDGDKLEREIIHLANRARSRGGVATAAGGVIRVALVETSPPVVRAS